MSDEYPECKKLDLISKDKLIIEEFLDWLGDSLSHSGVGEIRLGFYQSDDRCYTELVPLPWTQEQLLSRYFGIDQKKLETERRAMLEAHRQQHEGGE